MTAVSTSLCRCGCRGDATVLLTRLQIERFRCIDQASIEASEGINLFVGDNGAGKTSVLEAIFFLSRGQSFRVQTGRDIIQDETTDCLVRAELARPAPFTLAIRKTSVGIETRIGLERNVKLSELARCCPTLVLEPGQHRLLEDGPRLRRRYLDWSVFHVEPRYHESWRRYQRALVQRNALLRRGDAKQLVVWEKELADSSRTLDKYRSEVFEQLKISATAIMRRLVPTVTHLELDYQRGWSDNRDIAEVYAETRPSDRERGFTQHGPHRAEIRIRDQRRAAKDRLSRGQQKLLVTALVLAQAKQYREALDRPAIVLVDDLASELGEAAQELVLAELGAGREQVFMTSLGAGKALQQAAASMFHVKHGAVEAML